MAPLEQSTNHLEGRGVPKVVGTSLEGEPPDRHGDAAQRTADHALDLVGHPFKLLLVDGDDALEQIEVVARILGDSYQRP